MDNEDIELYNALNVVNEQNNIFMRQYINMHYPRRKYRIHHRIDPMNEFDDEEFVQRFRFSKAEVQQIYNLINGRELLEPMKERVGFTIAGMVKLMIALRFYATGDFYRTIGDLFDVSKSSVETIVKEVSYLIASRLRDRYIFAPSTEEQQLQAKVRFMQLANFPLCIGAVDGTHVLIQSFGGDEAELYRNRKTTFSLNVQLVVSADVS